VNLKPFHTVENAIKSETSITGDERYSSILIVEDNNDVRTYIKDHLQGDYIIHEAENGAVGIQKAQEILPDLIISDVMMPKIDGIELVNQLKKSDLTNHIPIILLTAKAGQQNKIQGLQVGADDYLTKPFDSAELKVRVKNLISQRATLMEKYKSTWHIGPSDLVVTSDDEKFLEKIKNAIESNIDNELFSVQKLASIIGFSRSQLNRKIKALIDKSPIDMIREFRLIRAKSLLEQRSGTVSEIAYQVGYSNLSYFTKSFKKEFGVLPSELKENIE
jgi:YesN/AraC family two-component response regulator